MAVEPQVALEQAVLAMLRNQLGYTAKNSGRTWQGEPPPMAPNVFVSVWHDGSRQCQSKSALDELHGVYVTVTVRTDDLPWDRWVEHRDVLEARLNAIVALLQKDCNDARVMRAANALGGLDGQGQQIGFRVPLQCAAFDAVMTKGADWFKADLEEGGDLPSGLAQTVRFRGPQRIRNIPTATAILGG